MKQKYKKLAFFILLLSMLTGCMLLSGCTENKENGSQSSYIVDSDELQDTENQMEFVPGSMKGSKQEETSENEEQGQTEQSRQTVAEENDADERRCGAGKRKRLYGEDCNWRSGDHGEFFG